MGRHRGASGRYIHGTGVVGLCLLARSHVLHWSLPVALPLILAAPISVIVSRVGVGRWAKRLGFLLTPEEIHGSKLVDTVESMPITEANQPVSAFVQAIVDPIMNYVHGSLAWRQQRRCQAGAPAQLRASAYRKASASN